MKGAPPLLPGRRPGDPRPPGEKPEGPMAGPADAGLLSPPFRKLTGADEDAIRRTVRDSKPDFLWGLLRRAPMWAQRIGCEWVWRLIQTGPEAAVEAPPQDQSALRGDVPGNASAEGFRQGQGIRLPVPILGKERPALGHGFYGLPSLLRLPSTLSRMCCAVDGIRRRPPPSRLQEEYRYEHRCRIGSDRNTCPNLVPEKPSRSSWYAWKQYSGKFPGSCIGASEVASGLSILRH